MSNMPIIHIGKRAAAYLVEPLQTAAVLREEMSAAGFPGPAIDIAVSLTAERRHEWRVVRTLAAVAEYAFCDYDAPPRLRIAPHGAIGPESSPWADAGDWRTLVVLIALDLHGTGGPGGRGGVGATTRMPWARELGTGRWRAHDGGAWESAAKVALQIARKQLVDLDPGGDLLDGWGRIKAPALCDEHDKSVHQDADGPWYAAYARHLLAYALCPFGGRLATEPTEEIADLSALLDRIEEIEGQARDAEMAATDRGERYEKIRSVLAELRAGDVMRYEVNELAERTAAWANTSLDPASIRCWEIEGIDPPEADALSAAGLTPEQASGDVPGSKGMIFEDYRLGIISIDDARRLAGI